MTHGWINLYKPCGITSNDIIGVIRRRLKLKKIGHAGTLDKLACGVLPVAIGEGTKIVPFVMECKKEYIFTIRFGESRTTDDLDGEITQTSNVIPTKDLILKNLHLFKGEILQIPPKYSALKISGKRASDLMRSGEDVILASRPVTIYELELLRQDNDAHFTFQVCCSKGFYVRSLARDIAESLSTIGCVSYLERTRVGAFGKENAILLEKLIENWHNNGIASSWFSIKAVLDDIPAVLMSHQEAQDLRQGRSIALHQQELSGEVLCLENGIELGIAIAKEGKLYPKRNFNY